MARDIKPPKFYHSGFVINFDPDNACDRALYNFFTKPLPTRPRKRRSKSYMADLRIPFEDLQHEEAFDGKPTRETVRKYKIMLDHFILLIHTLDLKLSLAVRLIKEEDKADAEKSFGIHQEHHFFAYQDVARILTKQVKKAEDRNRLLAFLSDIEEDMNRQLADIVARLGGKMYQ
jgi:hypothetical protein